MFRNYMIVALRNVLRQKLYAFINVFGLAVGLACCILIFLYVRHEWQYDAFHENADRIFRVIVRETRPDGSVGFSTLHPASLAASLKEELPGFVRASGFIRSHTQVSYQEISFQESFGLVDADFLKMFSFPLLAGDLAAALRRPDGVVVGETVARKLFGNPGDDYAAALGKTTVAGRSRIYRCRCHAGRPRELQPEFQFPDTGRAPHELSRHRGLDRRKDCCVRGTCGNTGCGSDGEGVSSFC